MEEIATTPVLPRTLLVREAGVKSARRSSDLERTQEIQQVLLVQRDLPCCVESVADAGGDWSRKRMKSANFKTSPKASVVVVASKLVRSSGVPLNRQPGVWSRSLANSSLVMPCSTL